MAVYSIRDIEKLTGIKAHTLRAWEQRYELIVPRRTETNIRYYLDEDLRELFNIALLNKNGWRISKIAAMSPGERTERVAALSSISVSPDTQLDALTLSTVEMDEFKFSHIVDTNIRQRGLEETMMEVIYPFLDKLGVLYFTGSVTPLHEAFIGNLIRQKILTATDALPSKGKTDAPVYGLYLPAGESQELSLLFVHYLMRKRKVNTIYMGGNVTPADLGKVATLKRIDYLFSIISNAYVEQPIERHVEQVLEHCPDAVLLLAGHQANSHDIKAYGQLKILAGLNEVIGFVEKSQSNSSLNRNNFRA